MDVIWTVNRGSGAGEQVVAPACLCRGCRSGLRRGPGRGFRQGSVLEHVVGGSEHGGGDGADGLLCAPPGADAQVLGLEVASFGARGRLGALNQRGLQPGCSLFIRVDRRLPALSSFLGRVQPRRSGGLQS
jgi:hypothetical protein